MALLNKVYEMIFVCLVMYMLYSLEGLPRKAYGNILAA